MAAISGVATMGALGVMGLAEGGFVPATPGGRQVILAEGGEGEFVIPASKMAAVMQGGSGALMDVMGGMSVSEVYDNSVTSGKSYSNSSFGGNVVNANYYINGYTDSDLQRIIRDTVNDLVYDSRLRGRYWRCRMPWTTTPLIC